MKKIVKYLEIDKRKLLIRLGIYLGCYLIFMLIDRLTKAYIFTATEYEAGYSHIINWKIIGFRPTLNPGGAFSTNLGKFALLQTIGLLLFIVSTLCVLFKFKLRFIIPIIFIGAGGLGNVIDRFAYDGYVRDLIYFPWWPKYATFNFADAFVVVDTIVLLVFVIIELFKKPQKETEYIRG